MYASIATFFGHVPWLGVYIGKIPAAAGKLGALLKSCAECTKARMQRGSKTKDLFYYLVVILFSADKVMLIDHELF